MWLHFADIWAKKTPEKSGQFLYEQTGSKGRAVAWSSLRRSWWVAVDASLIEFARDHKDVHKVKISTERVWEGACGVGWWGKDKACKITYHPFNTFPPCLTVSISTAFTNVFYPSLIKSCQVKLLLKITEYAPLLEIVPGTRMLSTLCPPSLFREACLWIYEGFESIIHKPGRRGTNCFLLVWNFTYNWLHNPDNCVCHKDRKPSWSGEAA